MMYLIKSIKSIIVLLFLVNTLAGCNIFSPTPEDVIQHGSTIPVRHIFNIPPIVCWTAQYALNEHVPGHRLEHPDPYVTLLPPAQPGLPIPPDLTSLPLNTRPLPLLDAGIAISAVCWSALDELFNPAAATPCDPCFPACELPWVAIRTGDRLDRACREQKFTIRDRAIGSATDPIGNPVMLGPNSNERLGVVEFINVKILRVVNAFAESIYTSLVGTPADLPADWAAYKIVINGLMVLMLVIFFTSVTLGLQRITWYVAFATAIKFILVAIFALDWDFFSTHFIEFFEELSRELSNVMVGVFAPSLEGGAFGPTLRNVIEQIDSILSIWISAGFWKFLLALLFTAGGGWVYALLFFVMGAGFIFVVFRAIYIYMMALIIRFLLYSLAPIFISLALFNETKPFFDGWLKQIINFTLQPVFVFAFLGMLMLIMGGFLDSGGFTRGEGEGAIGAIQGTGDSNVGGMLNVDTVGMQVCWNVIAKIDGGPILSDIYWWRLCDSAGNEIDFSGAGDFPFNVWHIFIVLALLGMLQPMLRWSADMAGRISGGVTSAASVKPYGLDSVKAIGAAGVGAGGAILKGGLGAATLGKGFKGTRGYLGKVNSNLGKSSRESIRRDRIS